MYFVIIITCGRYIFFIQFYFLFLFFVLNICRLIRAMKCEHVVRGQREKEGDQHSTPEQQWTIGQHSLTKYYTVSQPSLVRKKKKQIRETV